MNNAQYQNDVRDHEEIKQRLCVRQLGLQQPLVRILLQIK